MNGVGILLPVLLGKAECLVLVVCCLGRIWCTGALVVVSRLGVHLLFFSAGFRGPGWVNCLWKGLLFG